MKNEYVRIGSVPTEVPREEIERVWKRRYNEPMPVEVESPNPTEELSTNVRGKYGAVEFWLTKLWNRFVLGREFWNQ